MATMTGFLARTHFLIIWRWMNHDAIGSLYNLVDVIYTLLVLNLRDNLDVRVIGIEDGLNGSDVSSRAHKRVGNELDVEVDGQHDVLAVFLCQRGQVDMHARHVDALARAQHAVVLHLCHNLGAVDANDQHVEGTVVKQNMATLVHIGSEVAIGDVDHVVGGLHLRPSEDFHHVASLILNRLGAGGGAHLRTLSVDEYADVVTHLAYILYNLSDALL